MAGFLKLKKPTPDRVAELPRPAPLVPLERSRESATEEKQKLLLLTRCDRGDCRSCNSNYTNLIPLPTMEDRGLEETVIQGFKPCATEEVRDRLPLIWLFIGPDCHCRLQACDRARRSRVVWRLNDSSGCLQLGDSVWWWLKWRLAMIRLLDDDLVACVRVQFGKQRKLGLGRLVGMTEARWDPPHPSTTPHPDPSRGGPQKKIRIEPPRLGRFFESQIFLSSLDSRRHQQQRQRQRQRQNHKSEISF